MELAWGIGEVLLGRGCFGDGVGADDDPMMEVGAGSFFVDVVGVEDVFFVG